MQISTEMLKKIAKLGLAGIRLGLEIKKHLVKDSVSYPELIEEIQENIPSGGVYCAVTKKEFPQGIEIVGVYLDEGKKAITNIDGNAHGIWLTTKSIDNEISEMFQEKDMVLFS